MSKYKAILFDMDGTLVPMDLHEFTKGYFVDLGRKLAPFNIDQKKLVDAIWTGTAAMVKNNGPKSNRDVFWDTFGPLTGTNSEEVDPCCLDFYSNEFKTAKRFTKDNPLAKEAVKIAHEKAEKVILATNPIFPMVGQETRLEWVGLTPADFDFVTSYENSVNCKPNPAYFASVCKQAGVEPCECLMIGNDEREDMYAASLLGIDCYLVTDTMISCPEHPWNGPCGTFAELIEMLRSL